MTIETALILPDVHVPYHDKRAIKLILKVAQQIKPKICIQLGDLMDMKSVTGHRLKPKERALQLHDEFVATNDFLDELDGALPEGCRKHYIFGNHEYRLARYIADNAPALDGLFTIEEELKLKERGWRVTQYGDYLKLDHITFTHDMGKAGENAHRHARKKVHGNAAIGHTHRAGIEYEGSLKGPHFGAHFGWLASHKAHDSYKDKIGGQVDTVLGFGIGFRHVESKCWWVNFVPIINYKCVIPTAPLLIK
jgi:predicted phosphodiesterase